jgi:hypothetical protein
MHSRVLFLRESAQWPLAEMQSAEQPLQLVVLYNNPLLTARALAAAAEWALEFDAAVTLMAVYVLPYPSPLECQEGIRKRLERELTAVARTSPAAIRIRLVFARDREDACMGMLQCQSVVVLGAKDRWWPTREERLARKLAASGHSVALIKVK